MMNTLGHAARWTAVVCAAVALHAEAATYFVRAGGSDRADGASAKTAFKTLTRAAQALNHGDSVVVGPGTYRENVFLADRFSADGASMAVTGDESGQLTGDAAGAVIVEPAVAGEPALRFLRFRNLRVSGFTFSGTGDALAFEKCLGVTVERCTFRGLRRGVVLKACSDVRIESSVFFRDIVAISAQESAGLRLAHLTVTGSTASGLLGLNSANGSIRNSIFVANNSNFVLDRSSAPTWSSDRNILHGTCGPWGLVPMVYFGHEWFAAAGQDRHSVFLLPPFADPEQGDLRILPQVGWGGGLPGLHAGGTLEPDVVLDRDGKPFRVREGVRCVGAYDFPDPQPANGWTRLAATLDAKPDERQSAGVYAPDGKLVRMLVADQCGVRELWWDGLDDEGQPVAAGPYQVRASAHDVRLLDDGSMGDNGNPAGTFHCDNPIRIVAWPDGSFVVATIYDEAGIPLRYHAASGQSYGGVNLAEKNIWAIAAAAPGSRELIAGNGKALVRIVPPGERVRMANGAEGYPVLADGETLGKKPDGKGDYAPAGLAVAGGVAYVSLPGKNVIRAIDLATGAKKADLPLPGVPADLDADGEGKLWVLVGTEALRLEPAGGQVLAKVATGLPTPVFLAVGANRLAAIDQAASRVAVFALPAGKPVRVLGRERPNGQWLPVSGDVLRGIRDAAFTTEGNLLLCEAARVRLIVPETAQVLMTAESNFMDVAVPHPLKPEYVYCHNGTAFRVDPASGAWERIAEPPPDADFGSVSTNVVLGGKPFVVACNVGYRVEQIVNGEKKPGAVCRIVFLDVSEPARPRIAGLLDRPTMWAYATITFTKDGHLVFPGPTGGEGYGLCFNVIPFTGLDAQGAPAYDVAAARLVGPQKDPSPRKMGHNSGFAADPGTDDLYYMAVTANRNKMVPAWGASATGLGRSAADGTPLWFSPSSGGNYTSMDVVRDGRGVWAFAGKDFGGQVDVYDSDGLRVTTSNWGWPTNWTSGFVDLRFAVQGYLRPDGRPGLYVEDDNIGRFGRLRLDGAATYRKSTASINWTGGAPSPAATAPDADQVATAKAVQPPLPLRKVASLPVDGDWGAWEKAGVVPQILALPTVTFGRSWPDDLFQTFRAGTGIGALAHDGQNLYAYFLVTDDTQHFDAENPGTMWMFDSVELWIEEEQIGLGLLRSGKPALFKYRYHNREGREWAANYALPDANVWGKSYPDLAQHPLGRQLGAAVGVPLEGKPGYALMAKIPFEEIKLVGGIAGRGGKQILPTTGAAGEVLRVGVAFDGINYWGREQDFKVYWPIGLMFSDPTRNVPFALE